jgi:hypothetical protein
MDRGSVSQDTKGRQASKALAGFPNVLESGSCLSIAVELSVSVPPPLVLLHLRVELAHHLQSIHVQSSHPEYLSSYSLYTPTRNLFMKPPTGCICCCSSECVRARAR